MSHIIQKTCSKCHKPVSLDATAGQRCPHCGAYWGGETTKTIQSQAAETPGPVKTWLSGVTAEKLSRIVGLKNQRLIWGLALVFFLADFFSSVVTNVAGFSFEGAVVPNLLAQFSTMALFVFMGFIFLLLTLRISGPNTKPFVAAFFPSLLLGLFSIGYYYSTTQTLRLENFMSSFIFEAPVIFMLVVFTSKNKKMLTGLWLGVLVGGIIAHLIFRIHLFIQFGNFHFDYRMLIPIVFVLIKSSSFVFFYWIGLKLVKINPQNV